MLPPLRSSLGSGSSFQNHSLLAGSGQTERDGAYKVQFSDSREDSNPSSAGRLNVLLLAGRERIADHLSMLADALGEAVHLPRQDGELTDAYVIRLAETLSKMTPRQRTDVERQLNLIIQGLKLRLLFEAFGNPTGPEAARIVAYLETARFRDRDPLARSVVTSYRQHGGPDTGIPVETTAAAETSAGKGMTAAGQSVPAAVQDETRPASAANLAERAKSAAALVDPVSTEDMPSPSLLIEQESGIDARNLQTLLRMAFESGESGDSVIEAKATAQLLAGEASPGAEIAGAIEAMSEEPTEFVLDARFEPVTLELRAIVAERDSVAAPASVSPAIDQIDGIDAALATFDGQADETASVSTHAGAVSRLAQGPDYQPTLLTLKGWTEADFDARELSTVYEAIVEDGEEAQKMLSEAQGDAETAIISGPDASQTESAAAGNAVSAEDTDPIYDPRSATPDAVVADDMPPAHAVAAKSETADRETTPRPQPVAAERQALAQLLSSGRETPLFAFVPYAPYADSSPDSEDEARHRRDDDQRDDGDGRSGRDEDADEQAAGTEDELSSAKDDSEDESERAYGLYKRMAGWA